MIHPRQHEEQVDLRAVAHDDELLDRIAAGADLGTSDDPAVTLLRALVRDVDRDLDAVLREPPPVVSASPSRWTRHRRAVRGSVAVAVVGLGLSVSGVSAAVTGNPLAAYESVVGVFDAGDELPPTAAEIAKWNKRMVAARASVRAGDEATAHAQIDALRQMIADLDVSDERRAVLERRLDRLEERLERGTPGQAPADKTELRDKADPKDKADPEGKAGSEDGPVADDSSDGQVRNGTSGDEKGARDEKGSGQPPAPEPPKDDTGPGGGSGRQPGSDGGAATTSEADSETSVVTEPGSESPADQGGARAGQGKGRS